MSHFRFQHGAGIGTEYPNTNLLKGSSHKSHSPIHAHVAEAALHALSALTITWSIRGPGTVSELSDTLRYMRVQILSELPAI